MIQVALISINIDEASMADVVVKAAGSKIKQVLIPAVKEQSRALAYQNRKNFEVWDKLNRKGDRHYIATAVSDAHTRDGQSSPYMKGYLPELSRTAVEDMLCNGNFFGSNGPELDFCIGNAHMGGTCRVEQGSHGKNKKALMTVNAFDPLGEIESIIVYRGLADGEYLEKPNTKKIFEFYPMGDVEKRNFCKNIMIDINPGEFYRIALLAASVNPTRLKNNPIILSEETLTELYSSIVKSYS